MSELPPIEPDTKNWTWVLERVCPECGFDAATVDPHRTGDAIREQVAAWAEVLDGPNLAVRPEPTKWSPLEYACHVRDVFALYDHRLERMLTEDAPQYANWDQDQTAIEQDYPAQDPAAVRAALVEHGERLAARFDTVTGDQWERPGTRSDGAVFTVRTFAVYLLHDPVHHLWDVTPPSGR